MARWIRHVRLALGIFAVLFAALVYLAIRERPADSQGEQPAERVDPAAVSETTTGEFVLAKGTRREFRVVFERALTYADGTTKFGGISVSVPQRGGRDFTIAAATAEVAGDQRSVTLEGSVVLTASDGLEMRTSKASYDQADDVVRAPGEVSFARGRMSGRSVGATYDSGREVVSLLDRVRIDVKPDAQGTGATRIDAGAASFARKEHHLRFERGVTMTRDDQVLEGEGAVAFLSPDDRLERVEVRGKSRLSGAGGIEDMAARDMDLIYGIDGQSLQRATLLGDASIRLRGSSEADRRRLSAQSIDLELAPDGATLVGLTARQAVDLDLPQTGASPGRRIRSATLDAAGTPERGLTSARFGGGVDFREARPASKTAPAVDRTARARGLVAAVSGGFASFDKATFTGGTTFREQGRQASAPEATYDPADGHLLLVAPSGGAAGLARIDEDAVTVEAQRIDAKSGGDLRAEGEVRSILKGASSPRRDSPGRAGEAPGVHRPAVLKGDRPVNVAARTLLYEREAGRATYEGDAKLWQEETSVQANRIVLDERAGNLLASGRVRSTLRLESVNEETGQKEYQTTFIGAEDLVYDDEGRRATYTTDARMNAPEGDVRGKKLELFLSQSADALERAEAYEDVSLRSGNRSSFGARMSYFAADQRYVVSGTPVRIYEQLPQECRETIGRTLTFYRSTDSISVDGNEESRTRTTSGGKCPGAPVG
jgi:LPS export ABC transporter protein LptC